MKRIFEAIDLLERYPMAGRKGRIPGTREMVVPRTPFIIGYTIAENDIQILAVLHTSQRWPESF
jgi:plasmid stabilization system protein ParE